MKKSTNTAEADGLKIGNLFALQVQTEIFNNPGQLATIMSVNDRLLQDAFIYGGEASQPSPAKWDINDRYAIVILHRTIKAICLAAQQGNVIGKDVLSDIELLFEYPVIDLFCHLENMLLISLFFIHQGDNVSFEHGSTLVDGSMLIKKILRGYMPAIDLIEIN